MDSRLELALFVIASCTLQNEKTIAKDVMASAFDGGVQMHCQMSENCCAGLHFPESRI